MAKTKTKESGLTDFNPEEGNDIATAAFNTVEEGFDSFIDDRKQAFEKSVPEGVNTYNIDLQNMRFLMNTLKDGKHPAFNLPSKEDGSIETNVPTAFSYASGRSYQGYNQLVIQAYANRLQFPKDKAGNVYVATFDQICAKDNPGNDYKARRDISNFNFYFKQKKVTISSFHTILVDGKVQGYSTAITLYPIQAAKDWAAVNSRAALSPTKIPFKNNNYHIVFDASSPDITPKEWLANYLAAAKGNATFKTTKEVTEKVRNGLVNELEQCVTGGHIGQFSKYFNDIGKDAVSLFFNKIEDMKSMKAEKSPAPVKEMEKEVSGIEIC